MPGDRALRTGMRYRPLSDTVHDTWLWLKHDAATEHERAPHGQLELGIDPDEERAILAALA
jgi:hypothetical protein